MSAQLIPWEVHRVVSQFEQSLLRFMIKEVYRA